MSTYAAALPCPGTSMSANIQADVSAVARADRSGWDVSFNLYLIATNNSGYPSSASGNTGHLYIGGGLRVNWGGAFSFPSGHGSGYVIGLGSGSYFLPVTPNGTGTLSVSFDFTEGGSPTIGNGSGSGSYTLPPIVRGGAEHWNGSTWAKQLVEHWNGSAWVLQTVEYWDGSAWKRQG